MKGAARLLLALFVLLAAPRVQAGFDHELPLDQSGVWARRYQSGLEYGVIAIEVAGGLWLGDEQGLGRTFWQTIDSSVISGVGAAIIKRATGRARPEQGGDPHLWFKGSCCESFPSGEVTLQAGFVTPFIANYARSTPWVWSLELLPIYDGIARMKSQAHWQSDVVAGWVLGSAVGWIATTRETPLSVALLPRGVTVGFYKRF